MKIKCVDHVSINTKDFAASEVFYTKIMGFEKISTVEMDGFSISYFLLPDGKRLELFDYNSKNQYVKHMEDEVGLRHLAFEVEDVTEHQRLLQEKNVEIVLPTTEIPALGVRVLLFLDPNGVTIEFCEKLDASKPAIGG